MIFQSLERESERMERKTREFACLCLDSSSPHPIPPWKLVDGRFLRTLGFGSEKLVRLIWGFSFLLHYLVVYLGFWLFSWLICLCLLHFGEVEFPWPLEEEDG